MTRNWTFGQKLGAGFAAIVTLAVLIAAVAIVALRNVVESKDRVLAVNARLLLDAQKLLFAAAQNSAARRGFIIGMDPRFIEQAGEARASFTETLERLRTEAATAEGRRMLDAIAKDEAAYDEAAERIVALRRGGTGVDEVARAFDEQVLPKREALDARVASFVEREEGQLEEARRAAGDIAASAITLVVSIGIAVVFAAAALALFLTRSLSQRIGTAVGQVQSSSAELQAAANQQAAGAREQATAMNEITTTISELLATSRQIAESARSVAQIAGDTARAAKTGEGTVEKSHESLTAIRRQVDLVVGHMLDLGKKSQQVGAVLDIVSEMAEQTNILAINATIEAAGAGDAGKRFGVVADEIRKLADRVAGSTKEIRGLIEEVRGAVNTTVMATESGSKAVDAGSRQFAEVASAFQQIAGRVATTTEAAREIELSTKQQATAVEQVNLAIADVAQATKETEASSGQTLQTASQLASLSTDLHRLIRPRGAAA